MNHWKYVAINKIWRLWIDCHWSGNHFKNITKLFVDKSHYAHSKKDIIFELHYLDATHSEIKRKSKKV